MTIYPGRASPTKRQSNRQLSNEFRSRDSLRMLDQDYAATNHLSNTSPTIVNHSQLSFSLDPPLSLEPLDSLSSNHQPFDREKLHHSDWETRSNKRKSSDCDDFSDDSLEGLSLPPPPPPIVVPPPPSLSAPVTPNKRTSVAWEISLDAREKTTPRKQTHTMPTQKEVTHLTIEQEHWIYFEGFSEFKPCGSENKPIRIPIKSFNFRQKCN